MSQETFQGKCIYWDNRKSKNYGFLVKDGQTEANKIFVGSSNVNKPNKKLYENERVSFSIKTEEYGKYAGRLKAINVTPINNNFKISSNKIENEEEKSVEFIKNDKSNIPTTPKKKKPKTIFKSEGRIQMKKYCNMTSNEIDKELENRWLQLNKEEKEKYSQKAKEIYKQDWFKYSKYHDKN